MAGHSKWSQIKRKKEVNDKQKSALFSKLSRAISLAVIEGGGSVDPGINVRLRFALERAREACMTRETIERAIEKAQLREFGQMKEVVYEVFATQGVQLVVVAVTDNVNRTGSDVRFVVDRNGAKIGAQGSVMHQFTKCARIVCGAEISTDEAFELSEEYGAFDLEVGERAITLYVPFDTMGRVGHVDQIDDVSMWYRPTMPIVLGQQAEKEVMTLVQRLQQIDEVVNVFTNIQNPA